MKRYALLALLVLAALPALAQTPLRQSTARVVRIGPAMAVANCTVPVTSLDLSTADEAELLKSAGAATVSIAAATFAAITSADGWYDLSLTTSHTDTVGDLTVVVNDDSLICPLFARFVVQEEAVFDRDHAASATGIIGTAQTGDSFGRLGAPAGASHAADNAAIKADTAATLTDTADMQPKLGTFSDLGSGATLAGNLEDMRDDGTATYSRTTDSLQAIRDRGDAAWTTGAGACPDDVICTTVATAPTTTTFTATATPNDDTQLDGWAVLFTDNGDADSYCLRTISGVATGTITYSSACPFTVAAGDFVAFLPAFLDLGVDVTAWNGTALATTNPLPTVAPAANGGLPTVDGSNRIVGVQGTVNTFDGLLTGQRILTGTCDSGSTTTCVDNALTQADALQLEDRLICFDDSWCALITTFTPGTDTATTTKVAPSTRASKAYTIFPSTLE